jgi:hypothetical protein
LNPVNMTAWVHKECDIMDEGERPLTSDKEHWKTRNGRMNV